MLKHIENCYAMSWSGLEIDGLGEEAVHVGLQGFQEPHILVGLLSVILAKACKKEISTYFNIFQHLPFPQLYILYNFSRIRISCFCMFLHVFACFSRSLSIIPGPVPRSIPSFLGLHFLLQPREGRYVGALAGFQEAEHLTDRRRIQLEMMFS